MATVLYVDDEEPIRRVVGAWLTRKGHTVHTAADVASARELLCTQRLDGAFIDLWLGTESGLELQDWIDENKPEFASHVVFVTGDAVTDDAHDLALKFLGRPVLPKPFDMNELEAWVERWVS